MTPMPPLRELSRIVGGPSRPTGTCGRDPQRRDAGDPGHALRQPQVQDAIVDRDQRTSVGQGPIPALNRGRSVVASVTGRTRRCTDVLEHHRGNRFPPRLPRRSRLRRMRRRGLLLSCWHRWQGKGALSVIPCAAAD